VAVTPQQQSGVLFEIQVPTQSLNRETNERINQKRGAKAVDDFEKGIKKELKNKNDKFHFSKQKRKVLLYYLSEVAEFKLILEDGAEFPTILGKKKTFTITQITFG
jgi:hypothetical protein